MVSDLDLAPPAVEPTKRELIVVSLHIKRARDAIEEGRAVSAQIRPVFINRLAGPDRKRLIGLIEADRIVLSETEQYALRLVDVKRGESFFAIDRVYPD